MKDAIINALSGDDAKKGLHVETIAYRVMMSGKFPEMNREELSAKVQGILNRDVKKPGSAFSKIENGKMHNGKKSYKKGVYRLKQKRSDTPMPQTPKNIEILEDKPFVKDEPQNQNLFTGKAGECAVMSELLFRGYNVNTMLVDDGVDVVASRNNLFYFIQVKTSVLKEGKIYTSIRQDRFDAFIGTQIRYIIVARCVISGVETNLYFVFNNSDIQKFIFNKTVLMSDTGIRIKIKIDPDTRKPILYHDREEDISFYLNRFDL